jgi:hypothetical protein
MEAKRGAGSPVKTALLRLVAKVSAVDGGLNRSVCVVFLIKNAN